MRRWASRVAISLPFILAVSEVVSYAASRLGEVQDASWRQAALEVRREHAPGDVVLGAPEWTGPLVRRELGDLMGLAQAGLSDLEPFERVWQLAVRDAAAPPGLESREPALDRWNAGIQLRRWDLGPSPVRYDFREHIAQAEVTIFMDGKERSCPWQRRGFTAPGGVHQGVMAPAARHVCPSHAWLWVGDTVIEDLQLVPRACVWQHPQGRAPIKATFHDVPLGDRLVLYGGLFYDHEVLNNHGPVVATVTVDGAPMGRMVHRDGDGWKRLEVLTRSVEEADRAPSKTGDVAIEVTADNPDLRTFCWTATTRAGADRLPAP